MNRHAMQRPLEVGAPIATAGSVLVLLHGRGSSPETMRSFAASFEDGQTHIVLPRAAGNTWYPYSFTAPFEANEPDLSAALETVSNLLHQLGRQVGFERVAIAGFSQGACLALETACRFNKPLLAVAGFSGGLIGPPGSSWDLEMSLEKTPIFLGCHENDPHIPLRRVHESETVFHQKGGIVTKHIYPGPGHHLMPGSAEWLSEQLQRNRG